MTIASRTRVKPPSGVSATSTVVAQATIRFNAAPNAGYPVAYYSLYRDGDLIQTELSAGVAFDNEAVPGAAHVYAVTAISVQINESVLVPAPSVNIIGLDTTAPTVPGSVAASVSGSQATVTFNASTDAAGILHYRVFRNGSFVNNTPASPFIESGLANGTYTYAVTAVDASSNANESTSGTASPVIVSLPPPAPDTPTYAQPSVASTSQINHAWAAGPSGATPTSYELDRSPNGTSGWTNRFTGLATSFNDTGLSSGTQYFYRLRAFNDITASSYATRNATTNPASGGLITWHPGVYLSTRAEPTSTNVSDICNYINPRSYLRGIVIRLFWKDFESTQGNYSFTLINQALSQLNSDKRVFLHFITVKFNATGQAISAVMPSYMGNATYDGGYFDDGDDIQAKLWNANVITRKIAALQGIGAAFNSNSRFEGVILSETALGLTAGQGGYTPDGFVTQLERLFPAARAALPTKQLVVYCNYVSGSGLSNDQKFGRIMTASLASDIMVSGPDTIANEGGSLGAQYARGALGSLDLRGRTAIGCSVQNKTEDVAAGATATMNFWLNTQRANYCNVHYIPTSSLFTGIISALESNPNRVVTTCPSDFPGCNTA